MKKGSTTRRLPPIIGPKPLPVGERPTCMFCGEELRPNLNRMYVKINSTRPGRSGLYQVEIGRYFDGVYGYRSAFCGGGHAQRWAISQRVVMQRSGEYPKLKEPEIKASWRAAAEHHFNEKDDNHSWDFRLPDALLKEKL